jgi:hypothetical protein
LLLGTKFDNSRNIPFTVIKMLLNLMEYFQIEAAAKGNVPFLLNLDLLRANEDIRRQETAELEKQGESRRLFEASVEQALLQTPNDNQKPQHI